VRAAIEEIASTYQDPEEVINWYYSNQEQLTSVESKVLEDSVVDRCWKTRTSVDEPCSYQEAIALGQQANR
jgi:trigger factor